MTSRRAPGPTTLRSSPPPAPSPTRELDALATLTARRLAAQGVGEGDRVATTLAPGLDFAALLHALPRLGAALVPLNTRLPAAAQRRQARPGRAR